MNWKTCYRALIAIRRWLTGLIDYARARAYPVSGGRRRRVQHESENQPTVLL